MKIKLTLTPDDQQPHEGYLYCTDQFGYKWQRTTWFGQRGSQQYTYLTKEDQEYVQECYNGHGGSMIKVDNGPNDEHPVKIGSIYGKTKVQIWYYNRQLKKQWKKRQAYKRKVIKEKYKKTKIL